MPTLPETAVEATLATEKGTRSMVVVVVAAAAAGVRRPYGVRGCVGAIPIPGECIPRGGRESSSSSLWRRNVELKTFLKVLCRNKITLFN